MGGQRIDTYPETKGEIAEDEGNRYAQAQGGQVIGTAVANQYGLKKTEAILQRQSQQVQGTQVPDHAGNIFRFDSGQLIFFLDLDKSPYKSLQNLSFTYFKT